MTRPRSLRTALLATLLAATSATLAQTPPASRPTTKPAATPPAPTRSLKNLTTALSAAIKVDADDQPVDKFMQFLQDQTQTNIVVNWNALAKAGITKTTPVTLHLKDIAYEAVIQTLLEVLPAKGTSLNYVVSENTLEFTTNADLGRDLASTMYPAKLATTYTLAANITSEEQTKNSELLETVLRAEMVRAGEPMDAKGHELVIKNGTLVATVSERGQSLVKRAVTMLNAPIKIGTLAAGTQQTPAAKKTIDAYKAFVTGPNKATIQEMAAHPEKYRQFNVALLPGVAEELAKPAPARVDMVINDGGVILIGPKETIYRRTSLVIYDVRDLMKHMAAKNNKTQPPMPAADYQASIVDVIHKMVPPDRDGTWGGVEDLGKSTSVLIPYNGLLLVFATADTHRGIAGLLMEAMK